MKLLILKHADGLLCDGQNAGGKRDPIELLCLYSAEFGLDGHGIVKEENFSEKLTRVRLTLQAALVRQCPKADRFSGYTYIKFKLDQSPKGPFT